MRKWEWELDIKAALACEAPLEEDPYLEQQRAEWITAGLKQLPVADERLQLLCNELEAAAKRADMLVEQRGDVLTRKECCGEFNAVLTKLYEWADEHAVWLGFIATSEEQPKLPLTPRKL
jgi:hypothetical protein